MTRLWTTSTRAHRTGVAAVALGCALALAGCTGTSGGGGEQPSAPPASPTPSGFVSPPKLPTVPDLDDAAGVIKDVTMTECTLGQGAQTASGTAKNSASKARDLVVVVSWILPAGSDVVARGVAVIEDAKPGAEQKWTVKATVGTDQQTQCVLSARAGKLDT